MSNLWKKLKSYFPGGDADLPEDYFYNPERHDGWARSYLMVTIYSRDLVENELFNYFVVFVICLAGVNVGIQSYPQMDGVWILGLIDLTILIVFAAEVVLKILSEGLAPYMYFFGTEWKWNNFDFAIVFLSLPFWGGLFGGGSLALLRLVRLMRLAKLVKKIPALNMIIEGLTGGLSSLGYIMLLLFLVFYLFGVLGVTIFGRNDPFHFGSIPLSLVTLFRCATMDAWSDVMYLGMFSCEGYDYLYVADEDRTNANRLFWCEHPKKNYVLSSVYFVFFTIICALVMLSLVIGAVTVSMNDSLSGLNDMIAESRRKEKFDKAVKDMFLAQTRMEIRSRKKTHLHEGSIAARLVKRLVSVEVPHDSQENSMRSEEKSFSARQAAASPNSMQSSNKTESPPQQHQRVTDRGTPSSLKSVCESPHEANEDQSREALSLSLSSPVPSKLPYHITSSDASVDSPAHSPLESESKLEAETGDALSPDSKSSGPGPEDGSSGSESIRQSPEHKEESSLPLSDASPGEAHASSTGSQIAAGTSEAKKDTGHSGDVSSSSSATALSVCATSKVEQDKGALAKTGSCDKLSPGEDNVSDHVERVNTGNSGNPPLDYEHIIELSQQHYENIHERVSSGHHEGKKKFGMFTKILKTQHSDSEYGHTSRHNRLGASESASSRISPRMSPRPIGERAEDSEVAQTNEVKREIDPALSNISRDVGSVKSESTSLISQSIVPLSQTQMSIRNKALAGVGNRNSRRGGAAGLLALQRNTRGSSLSTDKGSMAASKVRRMSTLQSGSFSDMNFVRRPFATFLPSVVQEAMDYIENEKARKRNKLIGYKLRVALGELPESVADGEKSFASFRHLVSEAPSWRKKYGIIGEYCKYIAEHSRFVAFITFFIILAGINVGAQTDDRIIGEHHIRVISGILDRVILSVFTVEVALKIVAEGTTPWMYFKDNWNKFDFIVVAGSYAPGAGSLLTILRLLRLLRVLKLVKSLPQLEVIVNALLMGMSSIAYIGLLLFLCFYVFAILGMIMFRGNDPFHFRNLHIAMFTLFRCSTLDDWSEVMYVNMFGCDRYSGVYEDFPELCTRPEAMGVLAAIYFISFIIVGAQVLLTLFIGVVTTSMEQAKEIQEKEHRQDRRLKTLQKSLKLTDIQMNYFQQVFNNLDLDGGGTIEIEEIELSFSTISDLFCGTDIQQEIRKADHGEGIDMITFILIMASVPAFRYKRLLRRNIRHWVAHKRKDLSMMATLSRRMKTLRKSPEKLSGDKAVKEFDRLLRKHNIPFSRKLERRRSGSWIAENDHERAHLEKVINEENLSTKSKGDQWIAKVISESPELSHNISRSISHQGSYSSNEGGFRGASTEDIIAANRSRSWRENCISPPLTEITEGGVNDSLQAGSEILKPLAEVKEVDTAELLHHSGSPTPGDESAMPSVDNASTAFKTDAIHSAQALRISLSEDLADTESSSVQAAHQSQTPSKVKAKLPPISTQTPTKKKTKASPSGKKKQHTTVKKTSSLSITQDIETPPLVHEEDAFSVAPPLDKEL